MMKPLQLMKSAKQAILDAGKRFINLTYEQCQAWVDATLPAWEKFEGDVGAENIAAAQEDNATN